MCFRSIRSQIVRRQHFLTLNPHPQRKRRCTLPFVRFAISIFHSFDEFYNLIQDQVVELIPFKNLNRSVAFLLFSQLSTVTPIACKMAKSIRFHRECDGVWTKVGDKLQTTNCWANTQTPVHRHVWTSKEIRVCVHLTETFCEFNLKESNELSVTIFPGVNITFIACCCRLHDQWNDVNERKQNSNDMRQPQTKGRREWERKCRCNFNKFNWITPFQFRECATATAIETNYSSAASMLHGVESRGQEIWRFVQFSAFFSIRNEYILAQVSQPRSKPYGLLFRSD